MYERLHAGFAKVDITPDYPIGLAGYSNQESRVSEAIEDRIYISCIALAEGEETILVYTIDNCACANETAAMLREPITEALGISGEKVFFSATHSHNCPALYGHPLAERYQNELKAWAVEAARLAIADLAPATTMAAKKVFQGMNFTRHILLANGEVAGSDWKRRGSPAIGIAGTPDSQMVLVKFAREEKRDILMINWQGHPDRSGQIGKLRISPSYVGPLRDTVAAGSGMEVAYFTGADGNMTIDCRMPEHKHNMDYRRYAVHMGTLALGLLDELVEVEGTGIATARDYVEAPIDHSWDHMLEQANEIFDLWKATDKATGDEAGKKYSFSSVYQARAIRSRANLGASKTMEVNAFRVGGVGFVTGTYEMFSESGIQIKNRSPYAFTMVLTGNSGYIPSDRAFENRCYESDTGFYARGTAEILVEKLVELLEKIQ